MEIGNEFKESIGIVFSASMIKTVYRKDRGVSSIAIKNLQEIGKMKNIFSVGTNHSKYIAC